MSFNKKTLAERIFKITKTTTANKNNIHPSPTNCRISTSAVSVKTRIPPPPPKPADPDPGDSAVIRRLFHDMSVAKRPAFLWSMLSRENLMAEKLRPIDIAKDRVRLDGLAPPPAPPCEDEKEEGQGLTAEHARKLFRVAQLEVVKARLKEVGESWISYSDFTRIVREVCSDSGHANLVARALDESGTVVVLGNVVLLNPEKGKI